MRPVGRPPTPPCIAPKVPERPETPNHPPALPKKQEYRTDFPRFGRPFACRKNFPAACPRKSGLCGTAASSTRKAQSMTAEPIFHGSGFCTQDNRMESSPNLPESDPP